MKSNRKQTRKGLSVEAIFALALALINLALDQADVHLTWISATSVAMCALLSIDAYRKSEFAALSSKHMWLGVLTLLCACTAFGGLLLHTPKPPIRIVGYESSPLEQGKPAVITLRVVNDGGSPLDVVGRYRLTYMPSLPADLETRRALEDFIWSDVMKHPPAQSPTPITIPVNQIISVPNSGPLLSEGTFKGLQEGGVLFLMGTIRYSAFKPPVGYCVYEQLTNPARLGLCINHN